ncbi:GNAT family N-acetyltransferase [Streptomyces sp. NPDC048340]|uniref:GNAT family N-acetyltransferase n=1 Tax=Streptomyces sp. NPDC048340 TaxID=3365537 RepID=UPI003716FA4E
MSAAFATCSVRRAGPADWDAVEAFHLRCSEQSMHRRWGRLRIGRSHWLRLLRASRCWTASVPGDGVIALVSIGRLHHSPGVVDLGVQVADTHQRRGIGTGLVRLAAGHALAAGADTLSVYTEQANVPMLGLLHRLGPACTLRDGTHTELRLPLAGVTSHTSLFPHEDGHAPTSNDRHA